MATEDDGIFGDWDNLLNEQRHSQVTTELDWYLNEGPILRSDKFDILKWWSANSTSYPTLAALARDVLLVLASTVASESAFSMGGKLWQTSVTGWASRVWRALSVRRIGIEDLVT
jgi:hypothetical protein